MPKQTMKPADPATGPIAQFGYDARVLRQQAGKTYAEIAASSYYSKSAIWAVDQGHQLPSVNVLKAFVTACGGDTNEWVNRRAALAEQISASKNALDKPCPRVLGLPPPDPSMASTVAEYNDLLKALREWSGVTYRQIGEITRDYPHRVASSTLSGALARGSLPSRELVESFLRALGLEHDAQTAWLTVWQALHEGRSVQPSHTLRRWRTGGRLPTPIFITQTVTRTPPAGQEPHRADAPATPLQPPDPESEVRDWVLVDGTWKPTTLDEASRQALITRLTREDIDRILEANWPRFAANIRFEFIAITIALGFLFARMIATGVLHFP